MSEKIPALNIDESSSTQFNLYEKREKIYTRKIEGFFQRLRLFTGWPLLLGYFILPWINYGDRQAVLFDLPNQLFYIFGITFWPQDFVLLSWLLIIAAFSLFFFTMLAGRVWCGYSCPQTVWTAIYMWVEQITEGERHQRIRLDKAPWSVNKLIKKSLKHTMWLGFAGLTGFTFVSYFEAARDLSIDFIFLELGFWPMFWICFFTLATYINAGWLREQVCQYMCPYARFQAVMFDADTLIVSYDTARGERRGARKLNAEKSTTLGDCIDCQMCVQVCPTGIDIRDGLQHECIGCALCIDACDSIMQRMNYAKGLVRYTTLHVLEKKPSQIFRPRLLGYGLAILFMASLFVWALLTRTPLEMDVLRDRNRLYVEVANGLIENVYQIKLSNKSQAQQQYALSIVATDVLELIAVKSIVVSAGETVQFPVRVLANPDLLKRVNIPFHLEVLSSDGSVRVQHESRFIGPLPIGLLNE